LLSIDSFARRAEKDSNFYEYQRSLQTKAISAEELSYTTLWQDELNRRFQSTNFAPLRPGSSLKSGLLTVVRQLSFGGFCAVYLVKVQGGKSYVLKELMIEQASGSDSQKARELFNREAAMLMGIDHPQIVRCFEQFYENERDYLLLDYLQGVNLRQKVGYASAFAASEVLELAFQMVSMLDYLHSKEPPIVHRDFTPDNLILNESKSLVLIDFGAANYFLREATGTLIGKQAYVPPEQLRGKAVPQSDFYALGCTLNFLLTGEDPVALLPSRPNFLTSSAVSDVNANGIANGLADVVFKLTQLDVIDRPASCDEIKLLLTNIGAAKVKDSATH
jgi:serine/threonine protein kinase